MNISTLTCKTTIATVTVLSGYHISFTIFDTSGIVETPSYPIWALLKWNVAIRP